MNEELEEAIKRLETLDCDCIFYENGKCVFYEHGHYKCQKQIDIETVLKKLERLQEDCIPKDKIREILNKLKISDIEPWSTYKVDGEILFDLEELLEGK